MCISEYISSRVLRVPHYKWLAHIHTCTWGTGLSAKVRTRTALCKKVSNWARIDPVAGVWDRVGCSLDGGVVRPAASEAPSERIQGGVDTAASVWKRPDAACCIGGCDGGG
jgi:hypothetical protein